MPDCIDPPLISCLLVTAGGRFDYFRRSVRCWLDQTYPRRELLIVNEGPVAYQRQIDAWLTTIANDGIRCVWLQGYYTLGALRNISIAMAHGDVFCQWDDDDFSAPQRLAVQYAHMHRCGAVATYLGDQLHYYFPTRECYWDNWGRYHSGGQMIYSAIPGTLMASRHVGVRYPSMGDRAVAGEDSVFLERLATRYGEAVAVLRGSGYIHMYTYHGNNQVYDFQHHVNISQGRAQPRDEVLTARPQIVTMLDYLGLRDTRVMCRDGLAFVHRGADGTTAAG